MAGKGPHLEPPGCTLHHQGVLRLGGRRGWGVECDPEGVTTPEEIEESNQGLRDGD